MIEHPEEKADAAGGEVKVHVIERALPAIGQNAVDFLEPGEVIPEEAAAVAAGHAFVVHLAGGHMHFSDNEEEPGTHNTSSERAAGKTWPGGL